MSVMICTTLPGNNENRRKELASLVRSLAGREGEVAILFYGDGVYNLLDDTEAAKEVFSLPATVYAIEEDLVARGVSPRLACQAKAVDYREAVRLVFKADRTITGV